MLKLLNFLRNLQTSQANNSIILRIKNAKFSGYCYYMNPNLHYCIFKCSQIFVSYRKIFTSVSFICCILFIYSEGLFHQNNLNLNLYHPERFFHLKIQMDQKKLFKFELKIVWSHFKAHKFFYEN